MSRWDAFTDRQLAALEQGMFDWPSNLPSDMHGPIREAIAEYRGGGREPELILFLSSALTQAVANVLRAKLYQTLQDASQRMAI